MTSYPSTTCCYHGVKHQGTPTGRLVQVADFEVYISEPQTPTKNGILLMTDVLGHRFQNAQLIADQFARNGYFVFMPDLFQRDAIAINDFGTIDFMKWMQGEYNTKRIPHIPASIDPIIEMSCAEMRDRYGCKRIGAIGYCFGAKYAIRHLSPGMGNIESAFVAHPSFVEEGELKAIKGPLAIAAAEIDQVFPAEKRHQSEGVLKALSLPYQINLYSGVEHGFAVRCDLTDPTAKYAKESAFRQAVEWFEHHLQRDLLKGAL